MLLQASPHLWAEAFINVNSICYVWIKTLADRIESSWWHMTINNGTTRWALQGVANLSQAIKALKVEFEDLKWELLSFWQVMSEHVPNVPLYGTNTTSRPALEVLFHAILFTRAAKFSSAKNLLQDMGGHWLQHMPDCQLL